MKNTRVIIAALVIVVAAAGVFVYKSRTTTRVRPSTTSASAVSPEEARVQEHLKSLTDEMRTEMQQSQQHNAPGTNVQDEFNVNGLVLLTNTMKGTQAQDGSAIVGTVVNRRNQSLNFVQIDFNLYDQRGALVGTASARTDHLEAGAQWNFSAAAGTGAWSTFKVAALSGH
jgi:hypothetical protein